MSIHAIGDIQGCYDALRRLLDKLQFDPDVDRIWLTGDLVNRGPKSLKTLRFVRGLGEAAVTVLGNHDLHLLAVANGIGNMTDRDGSLARVLDADDCEDLVDWLRQRPLLHHDASLNSLMVHAGLHPRWTVEKALARAAEVEAVLRGNDYLALLPKLYGDKPARWSGKLSGKKRLRFIVNCLTRIRMVDGEGRLDFSHKGPPDKARQGLVPWYEVEGARWLGTRIVFGHWSALGLVVRPEILSIDTGCVWKRHLTAVRLDGPAEIMQTDCRRL